MTSRLHGINALQGAITFIVWNVPPSRSPQANVQGTQITFTKPLCHIRLCDPPTTSGKAWTEQMPDRLPKRDAEQIINTKETTVLFPLGPHVQGGPWSWAIFEFTPFKLKGAGHAFSISSFLFCSTRLPGNKHSHLFPRAKEQAANILHLTYSWVTGRAHFFDNWCISLWWSKWHCPWSLVTEEHSFIFKKKSSFWYYQHIILKIPCMK